MKPALTWTRSSREVIYRFTVPTVLRVGGPFVLFIPLVPRPRTWTHSVCITRSGRDIRPTTLIEIMTDCDDLSDCSDSSDSSYSKVDFYEGEYLTTDCINELSAMRRFCTDRAVRIYLFGCGVCKTTLASDLTDLHHITTTVIIVLSMRFGFCTIFFSNCWKCTLSVNNTIKLNKINHNFGNMFIHQLVFLV